MIGTAKIGTYLLAITVAGFGFTTAWASETVLSRIVSTSVCIDQFALMVADPEQIAGLSVHAANPDISPMWADAASLPLVGDSLEDLLVSGADLVILETWEHHRQAPLLHRLGFRTFAMPSADSYDDIAQVTVTFADAIGQPERGKALASELRAVRDRISFLLPEQKPSAVYFLPSGSSPGEDTFVHDLLEIAGFTNYAASQGIRGWRHLDLETLLHNPPDVFILSFSDRFALSARSGFARHPRYRRLIAISPTIEIESADWICAGPFVTRVIETLAKARLDLAAPHDIERRP